PKAALAAAATAGASDGRLLVRSPPAGAHVTGGGKDYGRTPATGRDLAHGAHRLRGTRGGFAPVERRGGGDPARAAGGRARRARPCGRGTPRGRRRRRPPRGLPVR